MEGLRGVAVLLVFGVHYGGLVAPWITDHPGLQSVAQFLWTIGHSGVDLFFVLSGYLIYGSLISRAQPFPVYFRRRVGRIYPTFLAVFTLYLLLSALFPLQSKLPGDAATAAAYVGQNLLLLPGILPIEPMITVAWSLSYEMFFYLAIPFMVSGFGLRRRAPGVRFGLFAAGALGLAGYTALFGGHIRLVMFLGGMILFEWMRSPRFRPPPATLALLAVAVALMFLTAPLGGSAWYTAKILGLAVAFPVLCAACFAHTGTALDRVMSWTPLRWLGNMSYSYYLIHGVTLKGFFWLVGPSLPQAGLGSPGFLGLMVTGLAVTLLTSAVLYVSVEFRFSLRHHSSATGITQPG